MPLKLLLLTVAEGVKSALDSTTGSSSWRVSDEDLFWWYAAGSNFSLAMGSASRKVCIGVFP
jgi:hypothetical protein